MTKAMTFYCACTLLLCGTVAGGWLHGVRTDRWGPQGNSHLAAEQLRQPLPERVGNWKLRRESQLEDEVLRMLQCSAYISRFYDHDETGDVVAVAVLLGPAGPIAVHTPEVCYSSRDYTIAEQRQESSIKDTAGNTHSFWELNLTSNGLDANSLRVLYGWFADGHWEAKHRPRFEFSDCSHLYKLQLASSPKTVRGDDVFDPCQDFLSHFLTQLQPRLKPARP